MRGMMKTIGKEGAAEDWRMDLNELEVVARGNCRRRYE